MTTETIYDVIERTNLPTCLYINDKQIDLPFKQDETGFIMNPSISRKIWSNLGDKLSVGEKSCPYKVDGNKFITLRLDGKGFSHVTKRLKKMNLFAKGYSEEFGDIMTYITKKLCDRFDHFDQVLYAFTQSDEITLLINCAPIINNVQTSHDFDGRRDKLITHAASFASMYFNREIDKIFVKKQLKSTIEIVDKLSDLDFQKDNVMSIYQNGLSTDLIDKLPDIYFDCRMAQYDTLKEAFEMILWRAYDCAVNGVSSGVFMSGLPGAKTENKKHTDAKLLYLFQNKLLPMKNHQCYGTMFFREKKLREILNPITNEIEIKEKWQTTQIPGPVLVNLKKGIFIL